MSARPGGSSQPGLPTDYGGGGAASSGPGTAQGHLGAPPSRMPGNGGNESKPGALARLLPPAPKSTLPASALMSPAQVRAMQQFLNNHGFQVAQDGIMGPMTKSAAAAFRANHTGGDLWNKEHGIGVHPATRTPAASPVVRTTAGGGPGVSPAAPAAPAANGTDTFNSLLSALLAGGGQVGQLADANSFGDAAAAPDTAAAATDQRQIALNPRQEAQTQADLSSWYGLNPKAEGYNLSVLGRLAQARSGDAQAATDASTNIGSLAQSLAGSIGGAANDGSSTVLGAGVNDAGTMAALGESQKQYADDMAPLLTAEARGAQSRETATNSQNLLQLRDQLAQDQGKATADKAAAMLGVVNQNNGIAQQRFANEGNLLSTLSQVQAVDPNSNTLSNAKTKAQIAEIDAQAAKARASAQHLVTGATTPNPKVNLMQAATAVADMAGVDPNDTLHRLPSNISVTGFAYLIGSQLQGLGLKKGTPEYHRLGQQLLGLFSDSNGNPIVAPLGWFGPGS